MPRRHVLPGGGRWLVADPLPVLWACDLGLDLRAHWLDIRRLVYSVHGKWCLDQALDPEEVISEVARRILVANQGRSPFDPARKTAAAYIVMQSRSAVSNLLDKRARRAKYEELGKHADISCDKDDQEWRQDQSPGRLYWRQW